MIDVNLPANLLEFLKYAVTVTGDVEEVDSMIPDIVSAVFNETYIVEDHDFYYVLFGEIGGIDNSYLFLNYGKLIYMGMLAYLALPAILFLNAKCSRVGRCTIPFWRSFRNSLLFNSLFRFFIELYIDICVVTFMNVYNVSTFALPSIDQIR